MELQARLVISVPLVRESSCAQVLLRANPAETELSGAEWIAQELKGSAMAIARTTECS